MTRKDYVLIAAVMRADAAHLDESRIDRHIYSDMSAWERGAYDQWNTTCLAMAHALAADNAAFDRARFLKACGVSS